MSNRFVILIVILVVVVIGLVYHFIPFDDPAKIVEAQKAGEVAGADNYVPSKIMANHYYKDGTHTLEGVINLPTPCHTLVSDAVVGSGTPEAVVIAFTSKGGDGICTQVISEKFFSVSFEASEGATMTATYNGVPVELVLSENGSAISK